MPHESAQQFSAGAPRVVVVGVGGYTGKLAAELLWQHPGFELAGITNRSSIGQKLSSAVPLFIQEFNPDALEDIDAAIVAYPHGEAAPVVAELLAHDVRVVDLSADFRLDRYRYEDWYGEHPHPELIKQAVYGLPELHRQNIATAKLVANPGCYPTATLLALAPLARAGLIADVVIDAKQGISGAGRNITEDMVLEVVSNVLPYKVGEHRHSPEIKQELERLGLAQTVSVQFQAHLLELFQGQLVSCYVTPPHMVSPEDIYKMFSQAYSGEPFISLPMKPPNLQDVRETNHCHIYVRVDTRTEKILVFAGIDNLWKGASSQAVQNLNIMFGLPETAGLE